MLLHGEQGRTHLEVCFVLFCFIRVSYSFQPSFSLFSPLGSNEKTPTPPKQTQINAKPAFASPWGRDKLEKDGYDPPFSRRKGRKPAPRRRGGEERFAPLAFFSQPLSLCPFLCLSVAPSFDSPCRCRKEQEETAEGGRQAQKAKVKRLWKGLLKKLWREFFLIFVLLKIKKQLASHSLLLLGQPSSPRSPSVIFNLCPPPRCPSFYIH